MRRPIILPLLVLAPGALAQLPPPPVPPQNPITEEKRILGKLLFWEEQLSSDDTIACGTCHLPSFGGSDPRLVRHPGNNGSFLDLDDKLASPGVIDADSDDQYEPHPSFGFQPQVTGRATPTMIMAAYAPELFWDGRASSTFIDPETGTVSIPVGGALESQVVGPPLSDVEMAHAERDWDQITAKLAQVTPMALATDLPPDMATAVASGESYGDLFADAFGDPAITAERVAFAVATYERTLIADDTPWDRFIAGQNNALTPAQQQGWQIFQSPNASCSACHTPPLFTNNAFRNIGLRPIPEDRGRQDVTGDLADRGRFKVPTLRNAALKPTKFHNGGVLNSPVDNMRDVVEFYIPADGHVHFPDNISPIIPAINIPPAQVNLLVDFLANGLTDPRVAAEIFPFDRPTLASERRLDHLAVLPGTGTSGTGGLVPQVIAHSPPALGAQGFRLGVHDARGGAAAFVGLHTSPPNGSALGLRRVFPVTLSAEGYGTWHWDVPNNAALVGLDLFAQWYVVDPDAASGRYATSDAVRLTLF